MNLYDTLVAMGARVEGHESDLYVLADGWVLDVVIKSGAHARTFLDPEGDTWLEIPFMYEPYWRERAQRKEG